MASDAMLKQAELGRKMDACEAAAKVALGRYEDGGDEYDAAGLATENLKRGSLQMGTTLEGWDGIRNSIAELVKPIGDADTDMSAKVFSLRNMIAIRVGVQF